MGVGRPSGPVSISLLGLAEIAFPTTLAVFPSRGFCLLALLALAPARTMTRAQAAGQLWESGDTSASLTNMRQLLLRMQRALPMLDCVLSVDDKSLRLVEAPSLDVCRFLELGAGPPHELLQDLMSLYRGDLLYGMEGLNRELSENLTIARTYLRERYFALAHDALKGITQYGHVDLELLHAAEGHVLAIDNSREETYRALISAYGAVGRPEEAKRLYGLLKGILHRDGIDSPVLETRTSLIKATTKIVPPPPASVSTRDLLNIPLPRVALLAPNWVSPPGSTENVVRALVEDVANELARHKSLITLAAHSSFQAANDGGALQDNVRLRASYTVSSFVRPGNEMSRLCVRLVNCDSGAIIWSGEYPLEPRLLLESRNLFAARIASELSRAVETDSLALPSTNPSSYVLFLRAQHALKACDLKSVRRARRLYVDAVNDDSRFAEAYSGISCSLYLEWLLLGGNDPKLLAEARELAARAITQDPKSSAGYWREAMVALYQHDFDRSERRFQEGLELHPHSADIMLDYADAMGFVGDANEAWRMFERALDLNPSPPDHYWWAGASIAFSRADYRKAIELCGNLNSDESVLRLLAASHGQLGNQVEAREYGYRLMETYPGESAESMTRLQPHRSKADLEPFIDGLRMAGIK
jgi:pentatricopeptide repeat protein